MRNKFNGRYLPSNDITNVVDDNCYFLGLSMDISKVDIVNDKFIVVVGCRAVGKSLYSKIMSAYDPKHYYLSFQSLESVHMVVKKNAVKVIEIKEVSL